MTLCIAFNFGGYALLAADTRLSWGDPPTRFEDDKPKVEKTDLGLITGAGLHDLVTAVKERYNLNTIASSEDMLRVVGEERARILETMPHNRVQVDRWLLRTGWFFTYQAIVGHAPTMRVSIVHGSIDIPVTDRVLIAQNRHCIIPPGEANAESIHAYNNYLDSNIRPFSNNENILKHAVYHIKVCCDLINRVSEECRSVGPYLTYGIHILDSDVYVSERISCLTGVPA